MKGLVACCQTHRIDQAAQRAERILSRLAGNHGPATRTKVQIRDSVITGSLGSEIPGNHGPKWFVMGSVYDDLSRFNLAEDGGRMPEGNYGIAYVDKRFVHVATDAVASRTIWYGLEDGVFVAGTSQRMVSALLGGFEFNQRALGWFLSSGALGPETGWDRRIRPLPPRSVLTLDRDTFSVTLRVFPLTFTASDQCEVRQLHDLQNVLDRALATVCTSGERHLLSLSGGVDSRLLALLAAPASNLQAVTWSTAGAARGRANDLAIAERVALRLGLGHNRLLIPEAPECPGRFLDRFAAIGEARIDNIAGYTDDFSMWEQWAEHGPHIMLRGDEVFGRPSVSDERQVWALMDTHPPDHYGNTRRLLELGLPSIHQPKSLDRSPKETLAAWRDRLDICFNRPLKVWPLNDLKAGFVEVVSPFLFPSVVEACRAMGDRLRTDKQAIRGLLEDRMPGLSFADRECLISRKQICCNQAFAEFLFADMQSANMHRVFGRHIADFASANMDWHASRVSPPCLSAARDLEGRSRLVFRNPEKAPKVNFFVLALRMSLAVRAKKIFEQDASA